MITVFLIAPYSLDKDYAAKKDIVTSVCKKAGIAAIVADDLIEKGIFNMAKTLQALKASDYFIADLSYERPSCYYEIGFAQALGKKTALLALDSTPVHLVAGTVRLYKDLNTYEQMITDIIDEFIKM